MEKNKDKKKILFVDDDKDYVRELSEKLQSQYEVTVAYNVEQFWQNYSPYVFDLIIFDIKLTNKKDGDEGLQLLEKINEKNFFQPTIVLTKYDEKEYFLKAMAKGAILFLNKKDFSPNTVVKLVNSIMEQSRLKKRVEFLEDRLKTIEPYRLIGKSEAMQKIRENILYAAEDGEITVLINGESGTGKELVARNIYMEGIRKEGPFIAVSISGFHKDTVYSDLFGHEAGSFTGAISQRKGFIEKAHEGIIFLDEIGDLDMESQIKLLRVLETRRFTRLGGSEEIEVDVQFIAATNKNLEELIEEGKFREDLYYRLKAFEINIPPLRDRKEDIPELSDYFLQSMRESGRTSAEKIDEKVMSSLIKYDWPGNVRELKNTIEFASIKAKFQNSQTLTLEHFPEFLRKVNKDKKSDSFEIKDYKFYLADSELKLLEKTIKEKNTRKKSELAKMLHYSNRFTFSRRIKDIFKKYPELADKYENIANMFIKNKDE